VTPLLRDMFVHQEWADAEHWRAMRVVPAARESQPLLRRLHHIHQVQRMFVWALGDRATAPTPTSPKDFKTFDELKAYAQGSHEQIRQMVSQLLPGRLSETIVMPWFPTRCELAVESALTQMAMHSHYHRGQNAMILRELGGEPPATDLIVWHWKGRPDPDWGNG
jgi:uncharacterized damage-inducible protein DinB